MHAKTITLLLLLSVTILKAQLSNSSFETWETKTGIFSFDPFIPTDTFKYHTPVDWTSSNSITMSAGLHKTVLADSSTDAFAGSKGLKLITDSIFIDAAGLYLTIPGFVVNGNFKLNITDIFGTTGGVNPANLAGAGVPLAVKKKGISFRMKYFPIPGDSCLVWAVLKSQGNVVAQVRYTNTQTFSNYTFVERDFKYTACAQPDTLVILACSSNPNFTTIGSGNTGLTAGSEMFIDSIQITDLEVGYNFPPIAIRDIVYTLRNTPKTFDILSNDFDCENSSLSATIYTAPLHGTATINTNQQLEYVPNNGYNGKDSVIYLLSDGSAQSLGSVEITVFPGATGLDNIQADQVFTLIKETASGCIYIKNNTGIPFTFELFDITGKKVIQQQLSGIQSKVETTGLANGVFIYRITTPAGEIVAGKIVY